MHPISWYAAKKTSYFLQQRQSAGVKLTERSKRSIATNHETNHQGMGQKNTIRPKFLTHAQLLIASRGPVPFRLLATGLPQNRVGGLLTLQSSALICSFCWDARNNKWPPPPLTTTTTAGQNGVSPRPTCILLCGNPTQSTNMSLSNSIYPKKPERLAMIHGMVTATVLSTPTGAASPLLAAKKATANSSASVVRQKPWESSSGHTIIAGICGCSTHICFDPSSDCCQLEMSAKVLTSSSVLNRRANFSICRGGSFPSETLSWL